MTKIHLQETRLYKAQECEIPLSVESIQHSCSASSDIIYYYLTSQTDHHRNSSKLAGLVQSSVILIYVSTGQIRIENKT